MLSNSKCYTAKYCETHSVTLNVSSNLSDLFQFIPNLSDIFLVTYISISYYRDASLYSLKRISFFVDDGKIICFKMFDIG